MRLRLPSLRLSALALLGTVSVAAASPRDEDLFIRPEDQHTVLFGSLDAGRSVFANAGVKQTPTGSLDRSGIVLMESSGYGLTHERLRTDTFTRPVERLTYQTSTLAGYQWALDGLYLAAFAGPELRWEQLAYAGRVTRLSRPRLGGHLQLDLWSNPTRDTLLTGTVVAGSTNTSVWSRVSAGYRVYRNAFVGPEITVYATPTYTEWRAGLHVTTLTLGIVEFRLSGGWLGDDAHRHGSPYGGLSAWLRL